MTRLPARFFAALALLLLALPRAASADGQGPYILIDIDSGKVYAENNPHQLWYPASVSKLMTAYVTFKALAEGKATLATPVVESAAARAEPPSKMGYAVGTVMTLDNALKMLLVHSANDIAVAIAEAIGGSKAGFVAMMNAQAQRLGMANTHYDNPNGLPSPGQLTTARDMAVLARALWNDFPDRRFLFGIPAIQAGKRILRSQNALLERYPGTTGMKTGFICAAGFNLVATASREGRNLLVVVLGAASSKERAEIAARLLNRGFATPDLAFIPRKNVATYEEGSPTETAIDMHDVVCSRKKPAETGEADEADVADEEPLLGPRVPIMDPVRVFTGLSDPGPGPAKKPVPKLAAKPAAAPRTAAEATKPAGAKAGETGKAGTGKTAASLKPADAKAAPTAAKPAAAKGNPKAQGKTVAIDPPPTKTADGPMVLFSPAGRSGSE